MAPFDLGQWWRLCRWPIGLSLLGSGLMAQSPLLGIHGAESALVVGIWAPLLAAFLGARVTTEARSSGVARSGFRLLRTSTVAGLSLWTVPVVVLGLNSLRFRQCAPLEGLAFMTLGPGLSILLAATTGAAIGVAVRRTWLASLIAVAVPLGSIVAGIVRFYATPAIFVFAHYVGWFPGTFYDQGVVIPTTLLTFRVGTLSIVVALAFGVHVLWDPALRRLDATRAARSPGVCALLLLCLAAAVAIEAHGPELGHRTSTQHIVSELGTTSRGERCVVHAPRELPQVDVDRLTQDCDFRVEWAERALGVRQPVPVVAFLFRSADEKRRLMGAARTNIAKPWRNEVYLQLREWPHPILAHEVAHVVAGKVARGPFRVAGSLGGWLPNPALIEGVAVAAAWSEHDELTPHQWARAMLELDKLPPLEQVFGLSFILQPARHAYTASGSFVRFLQEQIGRREVRLAYQTGDVEAATGRDLEELEDQWHDFLRTIPLPPEALELARMRFSGTSIFSAVCPHKLARLRDQLGRDRGAGDPLRVLDTCHEILGVDANDVGARAIRAGALAASGDAEGAKRELSALEGAPAPVVTAAREAVTDQLWREQRSAEALAGYQALLEEPRGKDAARNLEVKILAIEWGGDLESHIRDLLVPPYGRGIEGAQAVHLAQAVADAGQPDLGAYLEARQLHHAGRYREALPLFRRAEEAPLPTNRLRRENGRLLGVALFATDQLAMARAHFTAFGRAATREQDRVLAKHWVARIDHALGK